MTGAKTETPFGSWPSPITAELIVQASVGLGGPAYAGGDLWWSELRPTEAGRVQLVRKRIDAPADEPGTEVLPEGFSARTRVHEYGGGAWWVHAVDEGDEPGGDVTLFFTNWADQRLYRIDHAGTPDAAAPVAISPTAEGQEPHTFRFADGVVTPDGEWVVCVREWHGAPKATEARNEIVAIPADGSADPTVLVGVTIDRDGPDFVSSPRLGPNGDRLCWLQWDHPNMPWDTTELWTAHLDLGGWNTTPIVTEAELVAGGADESVVQPSAVGAELWFVSDRAHERVSPDRRWNLYARSFGSDAPVDRPITTGGAEFGGPAWVFGGSSWTALSDGPIVVVGRADGRDRLGVVTEADLSLEWDEELPRQVLVETPFTAIEGLTALGHGRVACIAGSFGVEPMVVSFDPPADAALAGEPVPHRVHRAPRDLGVDGEAWFSVPEHIAFPTTPNADGSEAVAYALFYAPRNPEHAGPDGAAPPLVVMSHGGPTSAARPQLQLGIQYWTSRGFAVVDVNYRGSTGYGRAYRDALRDRWGIVDVDDCIAAARYLAAEGRVDGERLAIRGGSAGGYTTLCALTFHDDFTAGTSLYGVADLEALAKDTHKFESRYLDGLIGPYPDAIDTYTERSPIHHVDRLDTPLLILQGLEDEVVPPAQAQMMADALAAKGVPYAYVAFEGEQHGFRQAPNIRRALEAELYFYSRIFGFELAEQIEPVEINGTIAPVAAGASRPRRGSPADG
jgi:dienelactone hydrolase